ncbi:MAG: asparaginase, partial [Alphaproteobacteria bacterium]
AILPGLGLGVAVKAEDGTKRASDVLMANVLNFLGAFDDGARVDMAPFLEMAVVNAEGAPVGAVRPQAGWDRL